MREENTASDETARAEFIQLREEKAADWRLITQINQALFAASAGIFAAGLGQDSGVTVALSPAPLFLGVLQMVRSAKLQNMLITFLATHAPLGALHYERRLLEVRGEAYAESDRRLKFLFRPSAWNTWLCIAIGAGLFAAAFPYLADLRGRGAALAIALGITTIGTVSAGVQIRSLDEHRETWRSRWEDAQS